MLGSCGSVEIKTSPPMMPGASHRRGGGGYRHGEGTGDIKVFRRCLGPGGNFELQGMHSCTPPGTKPQASGRPQKVKYALKNSYSK